MLRIWLGFLVAALAPAPAAVSAGAPVRSAPKRVFVIPIRDEIAKPALYVLRRGLKEAMAAHADVVVLDIKTPGGALDATFSMMEALGKFPGRKIAFVDNEAMSAGAFISATTDEIWFAPDGIIGAAAPVTSTGQDVDATMKMKIVSYLKARMRAESEGKGYRGQVVSAMIDADTALTIGGQVLKEKGELLSLTASEAMKRYGTPPQPLLGSGIAADTTDLLAQKFGAGNSEVTELRITWSEHFAAFLNGIAPVLLGLGMVALFIEFKTPGFGFFGIAGVSLLAIVFLSSYVAGLSGHEPIVLFGLGAVLLLLELAFFHSAGFLGVIGVALMGGSLVWAMADLWPGEPLGAAWTANVFLLPLVNLGLGLLLAVALAIASLRFLPKGWIWDRLVVQTTLKATSQPLPAPPEAVVGRTAHALTTMAPTGYVLVDGARYEAFCDSGLAEKGASLRVVSVDNFRLIVTQIHKTQAAS